MKIDQSCDNIRKFIADANTVVKGLTMTGQEYQVFCYVRRKGGYTNTDEVANRFQLTAPHASVVLRKLYEKGYLDRFETLDVTGGIKYLYESRFK